MTDAHEAASQPPFVPEKTPETTILLVERLQRSDFPGVLLQQQRESFYDFMGEAFIGRKSAKLEDVGLQLFISETPEELNRPEAEHWVGIVYSILLNQSGIRFTPKGIVPYQHGEDVLGRPSLRKTPFHVITWSDIDWSQFSGQAGSS